MLSQGAIWVMSFSSSHVVAAVLKLLINALVYKRLAHNRRKGCKLHDDRRPASCRLASQSPAYLKSHHIRILGTPAKTHSRSNLILR